MKRDTTRLLIDEPPLQVLPSLAELIGLNEAIFLQQLHYWLQKASFHDAHGEPWIYNTYEEWQDQFPFWSIRTIKRIVSGLKARELIETTTEFNKLKFDQTLWYTIYYDTLAHSDNLAPP